MQKYSCPQFLSQAPSLALVTPLHKTLVHLDANMHTGKSPTQHKYTRTLTTPQSSAHRHPHNTDPCTHNTHEKHGHAHVLSHSHPDTHTQTPSNTLTTRLHSGTHTLIRTHTLVHSQYAVGHRCTHAHSASWPGVTSAHGCSHSHLRVHTWASTHIRKQRVPHLPQRTRAHALRRSLPPPPQSGPAPARGGRPGEARGTGSGSGPGAGRTWAPPRGGADAAS